MKERPSLVVEREHHESPEVVIYRLAGKLTGTPACYEFLEDVRDDVRAGCRAVVLHLGRIERVSSPGIGILAACYTSIMGAQGRMSLVAVPEQTRMLLQLVCLWNLLPNHATEQEAIEALRA